MRIHHLFLSLICAAGALAQSVPQVNRATSGRAVSDRIPCEPRPSGSVSSDRVSSDRAAFDRTPSEPRPRYPLGVGSGSSIFPDRDPRYRLQPTDVVELHYRYTPEFDQTVVIQPDGFVNLQIVGDLKLQGLTLDQVKAAILEKASLRLKDPEITLVLKDFEKPYFVVGGEVGSPGKYEMRGQVTAVQAIAMAGGFKTASAKHSQVILFRRVGPDLAKAEILNLKVAMSPTATEPLADLHPGDMLVVPQNRISKIERFVKWANLSVYRPIP